MASSPKDCVNSVMVFVSFQSRSVIAFSSHCQLDNTTGRPLAGLINFCPFAVQHSSSSKQVLYGVCEDSCAAFPAILYSVVVFLPMSYCTVLCFLQYCMAQCR